jgi:hypothetical protein
VRKAGISFGVLVALAALAAQPAAATYRAEVVVAKTDKGGSCRIEPIGARAGTSLTYGGRVVNCSARFGVRGAEATGLLYEEPPEDKIIVDATKFGGGNVPYERTATYTMGEAGVEYRSVWQVTVVINSRRSARRPKRPEHWIDPGRHCNVYTTYHAGDTVGCRLNQDF